VPYAAKGIGRRDIAQAAVGRAPRVVLKRVPVAVRMPPAAANMGGSGAAVRAARNPRGNT